MYVRPNSRIRGLAAGSGPIAISRGARRLDPLAISAGGRRRGVGQLSTVAQAIETQEGYYPGSLAYVNNNPGNLMAAGQPGCTATSSGLCSFTSFADGWNALLNQISLDASRGLTISEFTAKYAPAAAGNDPATYADNIAAAVGLSPNDPLSTAISQSGSPDSYITQGLTDFSLSDITSAVDNSMGGGVDLSSIGLGVVDPMTLAVAGVGLLVVLWVVMRK